MSLRRILSQIALIIGTLLFSLGLQTYAQTWTAPTASPPASNAYAPITTGPSGQIKSGNLQVNALGIQGTGNAFLVPYGNVGIGTVSPNYRLDVVGNVNATGLCMGTDCRTAWPAVATSAEIYSCPVIDGPLGTGAEYCEQNTCIGQLTTSSTCRYPISTSNGSCLVSQTASCTLIGRLVAP